MKIKLYFATICLLTLSFLYFSHQTKITNGEMEVQYSQELVKQAELQLQELKLSYYLITSKYLENRIKSQIISNGYKINQDRIDHIETIESTKEKIAEIQEILRKVKRLENIQAINELKRR